MSYGFARPNKLLPCNKHETVSLEAFWESVVMVNALHVSRLSQARLQTASVELFVEYVNCLMPLVFSFMHVPLCSVYASDTKL